MCRRNYLRAEVCPQVVIMKYRPTGLGRPSVDPLLVHLLRLGRPSSPSFRTFPYSDDVGSPWFGPTSPQNVGGGSQGVLPTDTGPLYVSFPLWISVRAPGLCTTWVRVFCQVRLLSFRPRLVLGSPSFDSTNRGGLLISLHEGNEKTH